jgi:hypothetical protein
MRKTILFSLISSMGFAQVTTPATSQLSGQKYVLDATPKTVAFGYYDAAAKPVLHIHSGDTVEFHTVITNSPEVLEKAGVAPDQVEEKLRDIFREVTNRGPRRVRLRRLKFVREQFFLAAAAQNIKRLVRFLSQPTTPTLPATT